MKDDERETIKRKTEQRGGKGKEETLTVILHDADAKANQMHTLKDDFYCVLFFNFQ